MIAPFANPENCPFIKFAEMIVSSVPPEIAALPIRSRVKPVRFTLPLTTSRSKPESGTDPATLNPRRL